MIAECSVVVVTIILSLVFRFAVFPYFLNDYAFRQEMDEEKRDKFDTKLVAVGHAMVLFWVGGCTLLWDVQFLHDLDVTHTSPIVTFLALFSMGYFIYDSVFLFSNFSKNKIFVVHHVVAIIGEVILLKTKSFHLGFLIASQMEICNLFVHSIMFLSMIGLRKSFIFVLNGITLTISWTIFRILIGTIGFQYVLVVRYREIVDSIGFPSYLVWQTIYAAIALMNVNWWIRIVNGMVQIILGKKLDVPGKTTDPSKIFERFLRVKEVSTPGGTRELFTPGGTKFVRENRKPIPFEEDDKDK